jgi:hypothetical protein
MQFSKQAIVDGYIEALLFSGWSHDMQKDKDLRGYSLAKSYRRKIEKIVDKFIALSGEETIAMACEENGEDSVGNNLYYNSQCYDLGFWQDEWQHCGGDLLDTAALKCPREVRAMQKSKSSDYVLIQGLELV